MRAPISIVIPTLNSARDLPVTLLSLMEGLDANLIYEVVISDGGSTDETREIASEWGAAWLEGPSSRGGQLKRGVAHARGSWIFVLHADTFLQEGGARTLQVISTRGLCASHLHFVPTAWLPDWSSVGQICGAAYWVFHSGTRA